MHTSDTHTHTCDAFTEGCPLTHDANWARLEQEVLTVQLSSTRLPLLRLKARGAGAARPEFTSCPLGRRAFCSSSPRSSRREPAP